MNRFSREYRVSQKLNNATIDELKGAIWHLSNNTNPSYKFVGIELEEIRTVLKQRTGDDRGWHNS